MQSPSSQSNPKSRPPSSLACIPCRRRHLKCDAVMPVCSRCQKTGSECRYVRSRRGLRPKLPETNPPAPDDTDSNLSMFTGVDDPFPDILSASALADLEVFAWTDSDALAANPPQSSSHALFPATTMDTPQTLDLPMPGQSGDNDAALAFSMPHSDSITQDLAFDPMLQLFYQGFHRSHPFVLPRRALNTALARHLPESTLSIMRYLGAHFHPDPAFQELYRAPAYAGLADDSIFPGFRVQNLLLLAIAEHAHGSEDSAEHTIQMAISVALEAGMNKASFAAQHSGDSAILEESWRRTYWELYVINGMVAAMRDQKSFILHSQPVEVGLPCDESVYNACNMIPPATKTIDDLKNYWSHSYHTAFSPFAYRIEATRVLGSILALNHSLDINEDALAETTEATLVASLIHFPVSQDDPYPNDYDDMTFQAQMILYLAMIHLHHPRSNMRLASFHAKTSCTRLRALESSAPVQFDLHSQKLLRAANMLSNLATLPGQVKHRTPFFTCALAMGVIVHVAGCLMVCGSDKEEPIRSRIQLGLGALNVLGKVWPLSGMVRKQLVEMYHEVGLGR